MAERKNETNTNPPGDTIEISPEALARNVVETVLDADLQEASALAQSAASAVSALADVKAEVFAAAEKKAMEASRQEKPARAPGADNELLQILNAQNDILDCMLTQQKKIHDNVRERKWLELENNINNMRAYSDAFVNLDQCRETFVGDNKDWYLEPEVEPVFVSVRTKLSRSKIENSALATYVQSTQEFVDGVLRDCVPQKRNTLYNRSGRIVKPAAESVVVDTLF